MNASLQDALNDYWTRRAPSYDADQTATHRATDDREVWTGVWAEALPAPPARVVDVGTGSGYVAWLLHDLGHDVVGFDAAPGMIERAEAHRAERPGGWGPLFLLGDALEPPLGHHCADAVTARYVLWTMREPDAALRAWRELLRPGGTLVIVDGLWFPDGLPDAGLPDPGLADAGLPDAAGLADGVLSDAAGLVDGGLSDAAGLADAAGLSALFARAYAHAGSGDLPLATARRFDDLVSAVSAAGFVDVSCTPLTRVYERDLLLGVPAGHRVTRQYRITAKAP